MRQSDSTPTRVRCSHRCALQLHRSIRWIFLAVTHPRRQDTADRDNEARDERHITQDVERCPSGERGLEAFLEAVGTVVGYFQVASDEHICADAEKAVPW